jgi:hypothetical protein
MAIIGHDCKSRWEVVLLLILSGPCSFGFMFVFIVCTSDLTGSGKVEFVEDRDARSCNAVINIVRLTRHDEMECWRGD